MEYIPEAGDIVISKAGHDTGRAHVVLAYTGGGFALIADGKRRLVASPKSKNVKHLRKVGISALKESIESGGVTDKQIRQAVKEINGGC